jgi:hypothetical protein
LNLVVILLLLAEAFLVLIDPTEEAFAAFRANDRQPIRMGAKSRAQKPMPPMGARAIPSSHGSEVASSGEADSS